MTVGCPSEWRKEAGGIVILRGEAPKESHGVRAEHGSHAVAPLPRNDREGVLSMTEAPILPFCHSEARQCRAVGIPWSKSHKKRPRARRGRIGLRACRYFAKNATAIALGPTCVPIVLPIRQEGRLSVCPANSRSLSRTYFCKNASESPE